MLREVIRMLLEYPGKDRVNLEIHTGGRRVVMELPVVSTGYCEELRGRLEELLGANSVLLQAPTGRSWKTFPFRFVDWSFTGETPVDMAPVLLARKGIWRR